MPIINATCWVPCHLVLSQLDVIDDAYIGIPIVGATGYLYSIHVRITDIYINMYIYVYMYIEETFVSNM